MIGWLILACEIGFWVFILLGLFVRYKLKQPTLGAVLLLCTPIIDVLLIVFTVIDLRNGAEANVFHSLAAVYVGATIAFGKSMVQWADNRFIHLFGDGFQRPAQPSRQTHPSRAKKERLGWYRHVLAWAIGIALLGSIIWIVDRPTATDTMLGTARSWTVILLIDFIWSFSYTLWPKEKLHQ
ncbi:hypothetical protein [Paenibacillus sp. UMB4589-SE434]|uniref:hypothetical protein n=1 Tax=Paenibacillus sp. UMB4589-SE434 TaxID=3046314 RepID=UPI0025506A5E|nr:hypothetical protein [Paenibacillus sp. UMB4589-SE434]MDK8181811.1 hypothetical protein [Paenibacillus sp. UMB4589-SE434]